MTLDEVNEVAARMRFATDTGAPDELHACVLELEENTDDVSTALRHHYLGVEATMRGEAATAVLQLMDALVVYERLQDIGGVVAVHLNLGNGYLMQADYVKAFEHLQIASARAEDSNDAQALSRALQNIGSIYSQMGDHAMALTYLRRSEELFEELNDDRMRTRALGSIGLVYMRLKEHATALEYLQRSLELSEACGVQDGAAMANHFQGQICLEMADIAGARMHFSRALAYGIEVNSSLSIVFNRLALASASILEKDPHEARNQLNAIPAAAIMTDEQRALIRAAEARIAVLEGAFDVAQQAFGEALKIIEQLGDPDSLATVVGDMRDLAKLTTDFDNYVTYNERYITLTESTRSSQVYRRVLIEEKDRELREEREQSARVRNTLYSTLPRHIADRVARGEVVNDHYDQAAVFFMDIVGFTTLSDRLPPAHVVHLLEQIFRTLDSVCSQHSITKIKTIGDSYMAVAFEGNTAERMAHGALDALAALGTIELTPPVTVDATSWATDVGTIQVRIGLHLGPVTAGVIGTERMQYDVWGDTVNVASRMESSGEPSRIHVSEAFATAVSPEHNDLDPTSPMSSVTTHASTITVTPRGTIDIKGKGPMQTFWLERA